MERLTHKHDVFDYVLPEQNVVGDNQATEISLGETEYTCKKYIIGEAINKLGKLEDVLESWHIENLEELKTRLHDCQVYHLKNNSNETLIHNLKNELAELKQKAIMPKFKIGQEVWFVSDPYTARYAKVRHMKIEEISISSIFVERGVMYAGDDWAGISESELFATKEEAEQKLAEIGGKDE